MKQIFLLIGFFITSINLSLAQLPPYPYPCDEEMLLSYTDLGTSSLVSQSSTNSIFSAQKAIDGSISGSLTDGNISRTETEWNPYWQADLGGANYLRGLRIWYPADAYPQGLNGFYILVSPHPFLSGDLNETLSSPTVSYVFVQNALPSGTEIPLENRQGRYVRIQKYGYASLALSEIDIPGDGEEEICGNGIDDDGNCKTDCEDWQCLPVIINVQKVNPSAPIYSDGEISIQVSGTNLMYSLDNGATFKPCESAFGSTCTFSNLPEGDYPILVTNGFCTVAWRENPVKLRAPAGIPQSDCVNGDFESGSFANWTTAYGIRSTGATTIGTIGNRFKIVGAGTDPHAPIGLPLQGAYTARIGNDQVTSGDDGVTDDGELESATYKFTVDPDKTQFSFIYAVVLEEGGHVPIEANPYFEYNIFYIENGQRVVIANLHVNADPNANDFFEIIYPENDNPINYKGWTCVTIDLSNYIGKEINAEFITAECGPGPHFGYAYIDGLCLSGEYLKPELELAIDAKYCKGQEVLADAAGSKAFTKYKWKVCKLDNSGNPISCVEGPITPSYTPPTLNVAEFFGPGFLCGHSYEVTLTLYNDCSDPESATKTFEFLCDQNIVDYKDIVFCNTNVEIDLTLQGTNDCQNCAIQWTPSQYLNNPHIAFPTIMGSLNLNAYKQPYHVSVTNSVGCIYKDEVNIISYEVQAVTELTDFCEYTLKTIIKGNQLIEEEYFDVSCKNMSNNQTFAGELISEKPGELVYGFPVSVNKLNIAPFNTSVSGNFPPSEYLIAGNCTTTEAFSYENPSLYVGPFNFLIGNAFTPNNDGVNDTFGPFVIGNPPPANLHNAYWARFRVYSRWGQKVHDVEISSDLNNGPFDINLLRWNGTNNGSGPILPSDVYVWTLEMKNCSHPEMEDCNGCLPPANGCLDCNFWHGDVTLLL